MGGTGTSNGPGPTSLDGTTDAGATDTDAATTDETDTSEPTTTGTTTGSTGEESTGEPAECHPILAEILYDPSMTEEDRQWVKIYNNCPMAVDLDDYTLGWGGENYTIGTKELQDMLPSGACFLVGGPLSDPNNGNPIYDFQSAFEPEIERSEGNGTADGVALFNLPADMIMANTVPIDAVIYGTDNSNGLLDATGAMPVPHVGDASSGNSIRRIDMDTWIIESDEMPNVCPVF